mmetsp:Transcript_40154/g.54545  ORF Transcript_40154/g.54545 Transcript_40154/m.54545 type:complete len:333 (+) Transcript_40154:124-1122(+)
MNLQLDDIDDEMSVSLLWSVGPNGTLRHKPTGMKVSPDDGISFEGREYKLSAEDIEPEAGSHLGAGACGVVSKGTIKLTGQPVAIKHVKVDDKDKREQLLNDIKGLVLAEGCPNLVQWYAGFVTKTTKTVSVVLEFMDLGSLADLKKRLQGAGVEPQMLSSITQQIMLGLKYLHERKLLHRDIKPENILHNRAGEVKLTDFGIAKDLDSTMQMAGTFVGTVTYMAPERCTGEDYSLASDIWSVGMVIYELSTGQYPFPNLSAFPVLFQHLCSEPEPRLDSALYPPDLCDFVACCITREIAKRPDTFVLCGHPYVTTNVPTQQDLSAWFATYC